MTPNYGLPFPVLGDRPNGPDAVQSLAEAVDTALAGVAATGDQRWGGLWFDQAFTGTISDGVIISARTYQVTFAKAFKTDPAILLSWFGGQYGWAYVASSTAADMVVGIRPEAGGSTIPRIRWVALGQAVA